MFLTTFYSIATMFILILPGFIGKKCGRLNNIDTLVFLLSYVAQPFLIISSMQACTYSKETTIGLGYSLLFSFIVMLVVIGIGLIVFKRNTPRRSALALTTAFSNCGFMGIPVMQTLIANGILDNTALLYSTGFVIAFNFLSWTVAPYVLTGDKKFIKLKNCIFNPPMFAAIFFAIPLYFMDLTLPDFMMRAVNFLGNLCAPLSMIILGTRLAEISAKDLFCDGGAYLSSALKLIIAPLISFVIVLPFRGIIGDSAFLAIYISMAMPSATSVLMLSELFGVKGASPSASKVQMLSTLLCIATIPLLTLIV